MINNELFKQKILELAFSGKLVKTNCEWIEKNIDDILEPISIKSYQIKQTNIKSVGAYPVVSQSKELIEGYTDDSSKLFKCYEEVILFGDHSKTVKYINFPFVIGADGTKVFHSKKDYTKYIYYHMMYNSSFIKSNGYTRNYKYLKDIKYNMPSLEVQKRIADKIDGLFELIDKKSQNDLEKEKLKCILKEKILDSAIHGNLVENDLSLKPVDVEYIKADIPFEVPTNWKWVYLVNCCKKMYAGGDKTSEFRKEQDEFHKVPVVANGVINDGIIGFTDIATETEECLTISGRGTIGYSLIRNYQFSPVVRLIVVKPLEFLNIKYLKYVMDIMVESSKGTSIPQLTIPMIKFKPIPLPPLEEQHRIVEKIEECFKLIEQL